MGGVMCEIVIKRRRDLLRLSEAVVIKPFLPISAFEKQTIAIIRRYLSEERCPDSA